MNSTPGSVFAALVVALSVAVSPGCSITPDRPDEPLQPIEETGVKDLIQHDEVILAARVVPGRLDALSPLFEQLAGDTDDPHARQLAELGSDPIDQLYDDYELPNRLEALDADRPAHVLLTERGNAEFLEAARLGLPTYTDQWPAYFNVRVLLPTEEPEALSEQLEPWLDEFAAQSPLEAAQVYERPDFVRVELAVEYQGLARGEAVDASDWLAQLNLDEVQPPVDHQVRHTPAFEAFFDHDAPAAVWAPADAASRLATVELLEYFAAEHQHVGPIGQPRHFLEGVARIAAGSLVDDPVVAEIEDVSLVVDAIDEGRFVADYYATHTEYGAELREAMDTDIQLPVPAGEPTALNLGIRGDLSAVDDHGDPPRWTAIDDLDETAGMGEDFDTMVDASDESFLPFMEDPARLPLVAMATQSPRGSLAEISEPLEAIVSLPRAALLQVFPIEEPDPGQFPFGAAAAAAFEDSPHTRTAIEQLLSRGSAYLAGQFDAELIDRPDDLVELQVIFGADLREVFTAVEPERIEQLELSVDLEQIGPLVAGVPGSEAVDSFDTLYLQSHDEPAYHTHRVTMGGDEPLEPQPVDAPIEPQTNPDQRCRTDIAALSVEHLADLRAQADTHFQRWAQQVRTTADTCLEPTDPRNELIDERIDLAERLADELP